MRYLWGVDRHLFQSNFVLWKMYIFFKIVKVRVYCGFSILIHLLIFLPIWSHLNLLNSAKKKDGNISLSNKRGLLKLLATHFLGR